ncbi:MAG TPA: hypothetical protein VEP90_05965, partial [Methylomirabilota bacterium]|nr:hypothetical protein [Methylomirabilota bacterium]
IAVAPGALPHLHIVLQRVSWRMPYLNVDGAARRSLLNVTSGARELEVPFRSWELIEYPVLPQISRINWTVKTSSQLEKPRYVIVGFQTARKNFLTRDASRFDNCNITNIKAYLNAEMFPYDNMQLNFGDNVWALLYEMYVAFQKSYYNRDALPVYSPQEFKEHAPLFVIDCSRQNDTLKTGTVDIRLEIEASANFPANTAAYCLVIHDRLVTYNPLKNEVKIANTF